MDSSRRFRTVRLILIYLSCITAMSLAGCTPEEPETPNLIPATHEIMCGRQATAYVVDQSTSSTGTCSASAKIQAITYECGLAKDTTAFTQNGLKENIEKARAKCTEFCESQGSSCTGYFNAPSQCGLKSPAAKALAFGKEVANCPKHCKGQAFNYCSIYHANFLATSDPSLFQGMSANCTCRRKL